MALAPTWPFLCQNVTGKAPSQGRFFRHPEPDGRPARVWPVFLTYQGCPGRCVFCAQPLQTATAPAPLGATLAALENDLDAAARDGRGPYELAFYGGVFTALPEPWPERFLATARRWSQAGLITRVRCSTRPDACDPTVLCNLAEQGLGMVEIGAQTFDDAVLAASGRGHDAAAIRRAARDIPAAGLELGLQLLPGLPGHTPQGLDRDIAETCSLAPQIVRLYPCQVIEGTPLAALFRAGTYRPWDLETTLDALARAMLPLWRAGIRVARVGLAPQPGLEPAILAGPRHPALGSRVRARALLALVAAQVAALGHRPAGLAAPRRFAGEFFGHARELADAYAGLGLPRQSVRFVGREDFYLAAQPV
ncbi:Radical SAM, Pyruvate-formate lyase-activating enzyme like [Desulfovibrio sp. DV]|uniref:radical SAM protein n=1 Tax=Desulfovibrio sp. DV TaxID=1844708 RepID=UPI00094B8CDF|nr:radical SAM protein [Desulfovibrio sp. DV]OLN24624.1 Radical SAM, Pyruvate-formate lyase-activating enzyme like [Desulfovibrio sp. DV]